jgi:hypothetical protein
LHVVKVYYWKPKGVNIGHAAMDVAFGEGPGRADYVSWWPGGSDVSGAKGVWALQVGGVPAYVSTFLGDVEMEGGQPDHAVEIRGLDENRMLAAWQELKKPGGKYAFLVENCAQTVVKVMEQGGAMLSYPCAMFGGKVRVWAPWDVDKFARLVNEKIESIKKQIAAGFVPEKPGFLDTFLEGLGNSRRVM